MSLWFIIGLGTLGLSTILAVAWAVYLNGQCYLLRMRIGHLEACLEFNRTLAADRLERLAIMSELLNTYRPLSDKLVSAHISSTHIHLKIQSSYWQDQDLDKAIAEITSVLRDKL